MTAADVWGHASIDSNGVEYEGKNPVENWMIKYHYRENDGWEFRRKGPQRKIIVSISPDYNFDSVRKVVDRIREDRRVDKYLVKLLDRMLASESRIDVEYEDILIPPRSNRQV
jgi:hypothetical protein